MKFKEWRLKLYIAWYRFKLGLWWSFKTSLRFLGLAWRALRGKIVIVETKTITSAGGFKYLAIHVSKLPVSNRHTYGEL